LKRGERGEEGDFPNEEKAGKTPHSSLLFKKRGKGVIIFLLGGGRGKGERIPR